MQVICCEKCGGNLNWDEDLCPKCLDALQQCHWNGLIKSLESRYSAEYFALNQRLREIYPDFDSLDDGAGL